MDEQNIYSAQQRPEQKVLVGTNPPLRLAAASYLARFTGATRRAYDLDLRVFLEWCAAMTVDPFAATRPMIELYVRWMQETRRYAPATMARRLSTVCGFYRTMVIDGLLTASPASTSAGHIGPPSPQR